MKVLLISDYYPPPSGGISLHVKSLARKLSDTGHEVVVCTTRQQDLPRYEEENGVRIHRLGAFFQRIPRLYRDPRRKWHPPAQDRLISRRLSGIIEGESPDVIHVHGWILYSLPPLKKGGKIPVVHTLHDYRLFCPRMVLLKGNAICSSGPGKGCLFCMRQSLGLLRALPACYGVRAYRDRLKCVDRFVAVSSFVKEAHVRHLGIDAARIVVIPNFHDPGTSTGARSCWDFPGKFILFVGWLMPHKGTDVLIKAYRKLDTETKLLVIAKEHPAYHYQGAGSIVIVKNAPHDVVMQAMSTCLFAVVPSINPDPCPTVALEAMSRRKAVIASEIGGLKDMVVHRRTGILVPPNDPDRLAEAMAMLLQRPGLASEMGEKGYERFAKDYSPDAVVPKIVDVYESLKQPRSRVNCQP